MSTKYLINSDELAWRIVDGQAAILRADTTAYYGLNFSGTLLWTLLLEEPLGVDEMHEALVARHGAAAETSRDEVAEFVESLRTEDVLVEVVDETIEFGRSIEDIVSGLDEPEDEGPFEPPIARKFGTLEQLIISGE